MLYSFIYECSYRYRFLTKKTMTPKAHIYVYSDLADALIKATYKVMLRTMRASQSK